MYWSGGEGYDSGNMSVGAEDRTVTITGHTPGLTYNITIVALSGHLPSPTVGAVTVTLGEPHAGSVVLCSLYGKAFYKWERKTSLQKGNRIFHHNLY